METTTLLSGLAAVLLSSTAMPDGALTFNRIASFEVVSNLSPEADPKTSTAAEIIAATTDGNMLVYTDSPGKQLGLIDITDAKTPKPLGTIALEGEPTSVVTNAKFALVGVVTSPDKANPSGYLASVDLGTKTVTARCDLGGQPDSVALSPDGSFLAIAIENERDEEVNDGAIPQLPGGFLAIIPVVDGAPDCAGLKKAELTGLATVAPEDPEPEFVDINSRNEAVVTLQENNHIAIVDLATAKVVSHFSAGVVDLSGIDVKKDGKIDLSGKMDQVPREPDAVKWLDDDRFVIANEGDLDGGTRGFSIMTRDGAVSYDAGTSLEMLAVQLGHYPEKRNKKGIEVEGAAKGTYGEDKLFFIASERASFVAVYKDTGAEPEFLQPLPGGVGPEGLLTIPGRNLFVTAAETDGREDGQIGSIVTIYERAEGERAYPTIMSADDETGKPITWGALSGLVAHPAEPKVLAAVTDSFYSGNPQILFIDAAQKPALIRQAVTVTKDGAPMENLDLEGIAISESGSFWLASEGNPERDENKTMSSLVEVGEDGVVKQVVELPEELASNATRFGFEGITITGSGADETVWVAVQREWKNDPAGFVKLLAYKPATGTWGQLHYPLEPKGDGWIGLSEITAVPDGFVVVERDNLVGSAARVKQLAKVSLVGVEPVALDATSVPLVSKTVIRNLLPDLAATNGYVLDKVEGFAVDAEGTAFMVTDNDGIDGSSGETLFLDLGKMTE